MVVVCPLSESVNLCKQQRFELMDEQIGDEIRLSDVTGQLELKKLCFALSACG